MSQANGGNEKDRFSMTTLSEHESDCSPSPDKKRRPFGSEFDTEENQGGFDLFKVQKVRDDFDFESPQKKSRPGKFSSLESDKDDKSVKSEDDSPLK